MKKAILLLSTLFFFSSCLLPSAALNNSARLDNSSEALIQCYVNTAGENLWSPFRIQNRKVEFRYEMIQEGSLLELITMVTTGFNEGELNGELFLELTDGSTILLNANEVESKDYIQTVSQVQNQSRTTSEIFNRASYSISEENIALLKNNNILRYKMKLKTGAILIKPSKNQSRKIRGFIKAGKDSLS